MVQMTKKELRNKDPWLYEYLRKYDRNILNKLFTSAIKPNGFWTKAKLKKDAQKYSRKMDWRKNSASAYTMAHRNGWINECCKHMPVRKKKPKPRPRFIWTKELCEIEAAKHKTRSEWENKSPGSYNRARKKLWLDEIGPKNTRSTRTLQQVKTAISKCKTTYELRRLYPWVINYVANHKKRHLLSKLIKSNSWESRK